MDGRASPKRLTAAVYDYVSQMNTDDPPPRPFELSLIGYIDRFGVQAVMGRAELSAGEIRRMIAAENVQNAYLSRKGAEDWTKWAKEHPQYAAILHEVE